MLQCPLFLTRGFLLTEQFQSHLRSLCFTKCWMFTFMENQVSVQPEKPSTYAQRAGKYAGIPSQKSIPSVGFAGKLKSLQVKPA